MDFDRPRRRMQEINLTPLIDIVFHLMVFVMLTTTFVVSESMELALPSGHSKGGGADKGHIMRIEIAANNALVVDNQPMTSDTLNTTLVNRLGDDPDYKIAIFTTPGVTVEQLVKVMDMVYLTGGRNVQVDRV